MNEPDIAWAYALKSERLWHGRPGERILLRTAPIPRRAGPIRVAAQTILAPHPGARRRWTLRPEEVDEEGWLLVRLPRNLPRGLHLWRLCVDGHAGRPCVFFVG